MSEDSWTHAICSGCWDKERPGRSRPPVKLRKPQRETCCYCGTLTASGIFVRADPSNVHP